VQFSRRQVLTAGLGLPCAALSPAHSQNIVPIGDMHFHSFFGESVYHSRPLAQSLNDGGVSLVAWALVGDLLWFDKERYRHKDTPKQGEALSWLERELSRIKAHLAGQNIKVVHGAGDVDKALRGEPHVVLAVEGAQFLDNDPGQVKHAYELGIRHLQIVHFSLNSLGDNQTEPARFGGLSETGRKVIAECNRLGMLVDLAHGSAALVHDALEVSTVPVVWSHGSVTLGPEPHPGLITWRARQLPIEAAKSIAKKGGVIGLWALSQDVGTSVESYGSRILELSDWIGDEHVGFGTDLNGLKKNACFNTYFELRQVIEHWQKMGVAESRIQKFAIGNYARVLRQALTRTAPQQ
jgi:membrane dipeptidase